MTRIMTLADFEVATLRDIDWNATPTSNKIPTKVTETVVTNKFRLALFKHHNLDGTITWETVTVQKDPSYNLNMDTLARHGGFVKWLGPWRTIKTSVTHTEYQ